MCDLGEPRSAGAAGGAVHRSDFYQGLIIFASAFVHAERGNPVGIRKQMAKVLKKLKPYQPHYMGIDVQMVLRHAATGTEFVLANPQLRGQLPPPPSRILNFTPTRW